MPLRIHKRLSRFLSLENAHFLGTDLQLCYRHNGSFQTKVGGVLSLIVAIFVCLVIYTSFTNLLSTSSPVATVSTVYTKESPRFDLVKEGIFYHFAFDNDGRTLLPTQEVGAVDRFITIQGVLHADVGIKGDGGRDLSYPFVIKYKPSSHVKEKVVFEDVKKNQDDFTLLMFNGLSPELEGGLDKYFVASKIQDPPSYKVIINVFPCSLPNPADCASFSEFKGSRLYTTNTRKGFDASNFTHPLYTIVEFDGLEQIDPKTSKIIYHKVRDNEVYDDRQDFFDMKLRVKSADYFIDYRDSRSRDISKLHCGASVLIDPYQTECQPYLSFVFSSGGEKKIIVRTYSKFFNTLGEIGGTAEIFVMFAFLIYFKYNSFFLDRFLRQKVCQDKEISELNKKLTKKGSLNRIESINNNPAVIQGSDKLFEKERSPILGGVRSNQVAVKYEAAETKNQNLNEKLIKDLMREQLEENLDGVFLFRSLNELKVLRNIFFKPRHRKVLAIVLMKIKKEEILRQQEEKNRQKQQKKNKYKAKNSISDDNNNISVEEALERLADNSDKPEIEQIMDSYLLQYLTGSITRVGKQTIKILKEAPSPASREIKFNIRVPDENPFNTINSPAEGLNEKESSEMRIRSPGSFSNRSDISVSQSRLPPRHKHSLFGTQNQKKGSNNKNIRVNEGSENIKTLTLKK